MEPLGNWRTTRPFQTDWELTIEPSLVDGTGLLMTRTATFALVRFEPGPGPKVTIRNHCLLEVSPDQPLPGKPVLPLPATLDPSLPACFLQGQVHPNLGSWICCYMPALSEGISWSRTEWESQSGETKDVRASKVTQRSHIHSYHCASSKLRFYTISIVSLTSSSKAGSIATGATSQTPTSTARPTTTC
jgi:hypothetical protein